ncbi:hypothetical protein [Micromonospora sp. NPDC005161]
MPTRSPSVDAPDGSVESPAGKLRQLTLGEPRGRGRPPCEWAGPAVARASLLPASRWEWAPRLHRDLPAIALA